MTDGHAESASSRAPQYSRGERSSTATGTAATCADAGTTSDSAVRAVAARGAAGAEPPAAADERDQATVGGTLAAVFQTGAVFTASADAGGVGSSLHWK